MNGNSQEETQSLIIEGNVYSIKSECLRFNDFDVVCRLGSWIHKEGETRSNLESLILSPVLYEFQGRSGPSRPRSSTGTGVYERPRDTREEIQDTELPVTPVGTLGPFLRSSLPKGRFHLKPPDVTEGSY